MLSVRSSVGVRHPNFLIARTSWTSLHQSCHQWCYSNGTPNLAMHLVVVMPRSPMPCSTMFWQGEWGYVISPWTHMLRSTSFHVSPVWVLELSLFTMLGIPIVLTKSCRDVAASDSFLKVKLPNTRSFLQRASDDACDSEQFWLMGRRHPCGRHHLAFASLGREI